MEVMTGHDTLRAGAIQAKAMAELAREINPHLIHLYKDDCGSEADARRHDAVAEWLFEAARGVTSAAHMVAALDVASAYLGVEVDS